MSRTLSVWRWRRILLGAVMLLTLHLVDTARSRTVAQAVARPRLELRDLLAATPEGEMRRMLQQLDDRGDLRGLLEVPRPGEPVSQRRKSTVAAPEPSDDFVPPVIREPAAATAILYTVPLVTEIDGELAVETATPGRIVGRFGNQRAAIVYRLPGDPGRALATDDSTLLVSYRTRIRSGSQVRYLHVRERSGRTLLLRVSDGGQAPLDSLYSEVPVRVEQLLGEPGQPSRVRISYAHSTFTLREGETGRSKATPDPFEVFFDSGAAATPGSHLTEGLPFFVNVYVYRPVGP